MAVQCTRSGARIMIVFAIFVALGNKSLASDGDDIEITGNEELLTTLEGPDSVQLLQSATRRACDVNAMDADDEWEMVGKKGNQFVLNGHPFFVNGFNTYWLMVLAADQSTRGKVSEVFKQASSVGLTVCRTWAFNDGQWRALQKSPGIYDEDVFQALDFVVSEAKKYKIRLILSLINNWDAYGGKPQYVSWGKAAGLNLTSDDDFFSHPTLRSYYKAHAKSWVQEMAMYVKGMDPKHLCEIGLEGFYGPSTPNRDQFNPNSYATQVGTDFVRNHQVLGVDFASVHIYADSWISPTISDIHIQYTRSWMEAHIEDAEKYLGMPVLFSEFGVSAKDPGYNSSFRDTLINTVYKTLLNSTKRGGSGAGSLLWQLFPEGMDYMDDGYAIVLSKSPSTANIIALHSTRIAVFNSICSWRCKWGCKKNYAVEKLIFHEEL